MSLGSVLIDQERCKGCDLCVAACPQAVLALDVEFINAKGYHPATLLENNGRCNGCAVCAVVCPEAAIEVYRSVRPGRRFHHQIRLGA